MSETKSRTVFYRGHKLTVIRCGDTFGVVMTRPNGKPWDMPYDVQSLQAALDGGKQGIDAEIARAARRVEEEKWFNGPDGMEVE
jgi:hypothetical protein